MVTVWGDPRVALSSRTFAQAKLVRVISGVVLDVAVDIREDSPTYGQHWTCELPGDNKRQFASSGI